MIFHSYVSLPKGIFQNYKHPELDSFRPYKQTVCTSTPQERTFRPQRVSSPSGGLRGTTDVALNGRKENSIHLQLYDLSAAALHENWPEYLETTGIWQTEDGAHRRV